MVSSCTKAPLSPIAIPTTISQAPAAPGPAPVLDQRSTGSDLAAK